MLYYIILYYITTTCLLHEAPRINARYTTCFSLSGDYHVKISHSEVEVKFSREATFTQFKRLLLFRYPTLLWSKYSQRDSAQIQVCQFKFTCSGPMITNVCFVLAYLTIIIMIVYVFSTSCIYSCKAMHISFY